MKQITQKDIAKALNLARVTVTKALKNHPDISDDTIKKVKDYAEKNGYIPNLVSRNLSSQKTYTIGFVVPKIFNSFCASAIEAAHALAMQQGYQVIPMISYEDPELEKKAIQTLLSMRVDGIIVDVTEHTRDMDVFELVEKQGVPLVFIDRFIEGFNYCRVVVNDFESAESATNYAIDTGCSSFCFLSAAQHLNIGKQRLNGYKLAIKKSNIIDKNYLIIEGAVSREFGLKTLKKLYKKKQVPEAFICSSLSQAIGVHKAAKELGIKIPEQLSLITFGDIEMTSLLTPSITVFHIPVKKMAKRAVDIIIKKAEKQNVKIPEEIIYKSKLYKGETTK